MNAERGYQHGFSAHNKAMYDVEQRQRKAATMIAVLAEGCARPLAELNALDVGASTGIIDEYLARHLGSVVGIDIDEEAIRSARDSFARPGLFFHQGDAMALRLPDACMDVVICSQVYEHVPDAGRMMGEIHRVLRPGGVCYFAASNRLMWNEPHYDLPLLSVLPRPLAHRYVRLAGRAERYHELHFSYWRLRRLVKSFDVEDFTARLVRDPGRYGVDYMLRPGSGKQRIAQWMTRFVPWAVPGYIWLLRKPGATGPGLPGAGGDPWGSSGEGPVVTASGNLTD
ncbi:MAG: methyltransferase domain-containing protein [Gammaproteobacteria bacterium]